MPHPIFERRPEPNTDITKDLEAAFQEAGISKVDWTYSRAYVQEDVAQPQLDMLAQKGLKPIKLHNYEVRPIPTIDQKVTLMQIWGDLPMSTVHREESVEFGLEKPLDQDQIRAVKALNFSVKTLQA